MTPEQLTDTAAFMFGVKRADLLGRTRVARVTEARQALAWALRQQNWSLESIGAYLRRDHTTIIHALHIVERRAAHNKQFAERIEVLRQPAVDAPIDWQKRVQALEARVAELEAQLAQKASAR